MRFVRALIVTVYTLLALIAGLGILALAVDWPLFGLKQKINDAVLNTIAPVIPPAELARGVPGYPEVPFVGSVAALLGAALVLLALFFLWAHVRCSRKARCIAFENPQGEVDIAVSAVEDFIRRIGIDFPEVKEIEPSIRGGRRGISVVVRVVLWSGGSIPNISEKIQDKIKEEVQSSMGIDVGTVSVIVNKVIPTGGAAEPLLDE